MKVPAANPTPMGRPRPEVSDTDLMLAAAQMQEMGRLPTMQEEEQQLRDDFSNSFSEGYSARIGNSKSIPLKREFEIYEEEYNKHKEGKNPWRMSPKQLRELNK